MTSPREIAMAWLAAGAVGVSPDEAAALAQDANFRARAMAFLDVFSGPSGDLVLETILRVSLFAPPVNRQLQGDAYLRHAQEREGENRLACVILYYLNQAEQLKRTPRNDGPDELSPGINAEYWRARSERGGGEPADDAEPEPRPGDGPIRGTLGSPSFG